MRADALAFYARMHWAVESMLESAAFEGLKWTSLQPNAFASVWLGGAAGWVQVAKEKGQDAAGLLKMPADEEARCAPVDSEEVGALAGTLLLLPEGEVEKYSRRKLVINGPEDITGKEIREIVEEALGEKVKEVGYRNMDWIEDYHIPEKFGGTRSVVLSMRHAVQICWDEKCMAEHTSQEVRELAMPKRGAKMVLREMALRI